MKIKLLISLFVLFLSFQVIFADDIIFIVEGETQIMKEPVNIVLNNNPIVFEEKPYIYKSRSIVPIKFLFDELGYDITWDNDTKTVNAIRGNNNISLQIGNNDIFFNNELIYSDITPVIINDRAYIPLSIVSQLSGAEVIWENDTRTIYINQKIEDLNVYYSRSSYENYKKLSQFESFNNIDSISYTWSKLEINDFKIKLNTSSINNNLMYYPEGYEYVTNNNIEKKLLNIYFSGNYDDLFKQKESLVSVISSKVLKPQVNDPVFDGIVIDFEMMNSKYFDDYLNIIKLLREELKKDDKKLYIAIQPKDNYSYNELIKNVDKMIVMLHDYESKNNVIINFNKNYVNQPITPISEVEADLKMITSQIETLSDLSKISIQLNLAVVQWQGETFYEVTRYTPSYTTLTSRMDKLLDNNFLYQETYENPYLQYVDENELINTIWYENESSIQSKIDLVFKYKLGGISLWQIANIPLFENEKLEKYNLNIWEKLIKNY